MPITQSKASARVQKRFPEMLLIESDHAGLTAFTIIAPYLSNRLVFDGGFFIHSQTDHKKSSSTLSICSCYCIIISLKAMPLPIQINYFFLLHSFPSSSSIIINELKKTLCILSHGDMTQFLFFMRLNCTIFLSFHLAKKNNNKTHSMNNKKKIIIKLI